MPTEEPLAFKVEWFDQSSGLHRLFTLSFYEGDNSIEMFDIKLKRLFLRRCNIASVSKKELFLGNTIAVYGRHLVIKEYGNDYTKGQVENSKQSTLVLIYPEAHDEVGHVLDCLERAGYSLCRARSTRFTITTATEFYDRFRVKGHDITDQVNRLSHHERPSTALEIVGPAAVSKWRTCIRPSVQFDGELSYDDQELNHRGLYGSKTLNDAEWELHYIFDQKRINVQPEPPVRLSCGPYVTCCLIKPHSLREGISGRIIKDIQSSGFHLFGLQTFVMTKKEVEDFYEIYKGLPNTDYSGLMRQGSSGRCLVLALSQGPGLQLSEEIPTLVEAFRKLCGPADPEVCRAIYPDSLRAKYGSLSQEENALHCSDLDEDGLLEVEYFFTLMQPYQEL